MSAPPPIPAAALEGFAAGLLRAGGFTAAQAPAVAELLVWADLRGMASHGVLRIPRYVEMVETGLIDPAAEPRTLRSVGALRLMEAGRAPGAVAMRAAMEAAVEAARGHGVGWCAARNITHAGAVGYFALMAARAGLVGIVMTASGPLMAYHGAAGSALSTNPIACAAPSAGGDPVLLDMATSAVSLGRIAAARDAGREIPPDWGVDAQGRPTTDPAAVETLLPMAGPKGSGLSLMVEVLCSLSVANPVIAPALAGTAKGRMNGLAIALDPAALSGEDGFADEVRTLGEAIHALPPAPGVEAVLLPGERGFATAARRRAEGVPLAAGTRKRLVALARRLEVALPEAIGPG